jgi:hypothetical protein
MLQLNSKSLLMNQPEDEILKEHLERLVESKLDLSQGRRKR